LPRTLASMEIGGTENGMTRIVHRLVVLVEENGGESVNNAEDVFASTKFIVILPSGRLEGTGIVCSAKTMQYCRSHTRMAIDGGWDDVRVARRAWHVLSERRVTRPCEILSDFR
jgi:hypothetical protein